MEQVRIFEIKESDPVYVQEINRLLCQLAPDSVVFTDADLNEIISSPDSHVFLLSYGDKIAGMLSVGSYKTPIGRKCWIEDVVVDRDFRGRSFGRELTEYAIRYARERGNVILMLTSSPSRIAANHLYRSAGFELKQTNVYRMNIPEGV